jgi:hypothetical protein
VISPAAASAQTQGALKISAPMAMVRVQLIVRRPDAIIGLGEIRIHAQTTTFEVRASEVANPRPGDRRRDACDPG